MRNIYQSPLNTRYSSYEMSHIFSDETKFRTFRRLWTELARAEKELGLNITEEQVRELEENIENKPVFTVMLTTIQKQDHSHI